MRETALRRVVVGEMVKLCRKVRRMRYGPLLERLAGRQEEIWD